MFSLQCHSNGPMLPHVPKFVKAAGEKALRQHEQLQEEARQKMVDEAPQQLSVSLESVAELCKTGAENTAFWKQMLETARKHTQ